MSGWQEYRASVRQRRNEMRAARGAPPLPERRRSTGGLGEDAPPSWEETPDAAGGEETRGADLQAALQQREAELDEARRIIRELKDYAEQLQNRVVELIAGNEPMAKVLRLPGVKTWLLQRFHPDKFPDADERQNALLNDAMKAITAAYATVAKEFQSDD
jgi:hypothetical protein